MTYIKDLWKEDILIINIHVRYHIDYFKYLSYIDHLDKLKKTHLSGKTKSVEWRRSQLKALLKGMTEMREELCEVVKKDIGKDPFITEITDLNPCIWDTKYHINHLD